MVKIMEDLKRLRKQIDELDKEILVLLAKRMDVVFQIGKIKRTQEIPFLDKKRWNEVLRSKMLLGKELYLDEHFVEQLYELVHLYALKIEKEDKR